MFTFSRRLYHAISIPLLAFTLVLIPVYADKPLSSVADLRYGVTLYHYFQGEHFEALSELMVAQERGGIQGHQDYPELVEGSLNLAFGMDQRAGALFSRLLRDDKPQDVRNAAWFYLARIRYQRGEYPGARESLAKIIKPSADLVDEIEVMEIQLLMLDKNYDEAEQRLAKAAAKAKKPSQFQYWRPYLQFNLGAIYGRLERMPEAQTLFSQVVRQRLSSNSAYHQEQLALYDKAFTAAGYGYFQQQDYQQAVDNFGQVRQAAPLANDALLGYGWAKARQGDYQGALAPWLLLVQKPLADDAVQEALLAIPYAYLQLGDVQQALASYAQAEQVYLQELQQIDQTGAEVQGKTLVELLDLDNSNARYSWLLPENNTLVASPSRYLFPLYSYNRFQNSVQTLFDLHHIQQRLQAWQGNLAAYRDLMDYRLHTFRRQQEPEGYRGMVDSLSQLQVQRDKMVAVLAAAKGDNNVLMLLDDERKDLLSLVESGENNIQRLVGGGEQVPEEAAWLQRYRGMLQWSATLDFDERLWQMESAISSIDVALVLSNETRRKINRLLREAPDITSAKTRIDDYGEKIAAVLARNQTMMAKIEGELKTQIYASLALQRQRVQFYLGETRLALAQLYDNKYLGSVDHSSPRLLESKKALIKARGEKFSGSK